MNASEIARLETWLRAKFGSVSIKISVAKVGATPEIWVSGEFLGTVHRDDDDGEVSYSVNIVVLAEDLA